MNKANVEIAPTVMRRVVANNYKFNMIGWRGFIPQQEITTERELHGCGTAACFAGWLAVSPEFHAAGGSCSSRIGYPIFDNRDAQDAVESFLGMERDDVYALIASDEELGVDLYDCNIGAITPHQVIEKLEKLLETGSIWG